MDQAAKAPIGAFTTLMHVRSALLQRGICLCSEFQGCRDTGVWFSEHKVEREETTANSPLSAPSLTGIDAAQTLLGKAEHLQRCGATVDGRSAEGSEW